MGSNVSEQKTSTIINWQENLTRLLKSASSSNRVALVGIGHPLRGDDYAGSLIAKALVKKAGNYSRNGLYIFDAEDDVEGMISKLAKLHPKHVVFIDACEMKMKPGELKLLSIADTSYPFFTTHGIPLKLLAQKLLPESEAWILAIQPESLELADLSTKLKETAKSVIGLIGSGLKETELTNA